MSKFEYSGFSTSASDEAPEVDIDELEYWVSVREGQCVPVARDKASGRYIHMRVQELRVWRMGGKQ